MHESKAMDLERLSLKEKNEIINKLCCEIYYQDVNSLIAQAYHNGLLPFEIQIIINETIDIAEILYPLYEKYILGKCSTCKLINISLKEYENRLDIYINELMENKNILIQKGYLKEGVSLCSK